MVRAALLANGRWCCHRLALRVLKKKGSAQPKRGPSFLTPRQLLRAINSGGACNLDAGGQMKSCVVDNAIGWARRLPLPAKKKSESWHWTIQTSNRCGHASAKSDTSPAIFCVQSIRAALAISTRRPDEIVRRGYVSVAFS